MPPPKPSSLWIVRGFAPASSIIRIMTVLQMPPNGWPLKIIGLPDM